MVFFHTQQIMKLNTSFVVMSRQNGHCKPFPPFFSKIYLFYVYQCFDFMNVWVPGAHRSQKKVLNPLIPELQTVVSSYVDTGS